jgi:hypothetical protein
MATRWVTEREDGMEPQTKKKRLPENSVGLRVGLRFESDTKRDDALFERSWFADFRQQWRDALKREHLIFIVKLEGI